MKRMLLLLLCLLLAFPAALAEENAPAERLPDETLMTYYDHTLFVGDSLIRMFRNYVKDMQKKDPGFFPGIKFYSSYSYQLRSASREYVNSSSSEKTNLTYKGSDATFSEILKGEKPEKVFLLAGLNDKIHEHLDWAESCVDKIMAIVEKRSPSTQMYFFSLTPVTQSVENKRHIREKFDDYNAWLAEKCQSVGAIYVDIATALKDENGLLPRAISSDGEYHLNEQGNAIWAQALLDYAQAQYDLGLWVPAP